MYCCSLASEPVITYWNLKYGPTETNRQNRPRNKNRRPCQELIFFNYNLKNRQIISKYVPLVDNPVLLIKLTDLPVKYGRKQLRKANTRTTLGHESPILNWRDGALISFTTFQNIDCTVKLGDKKWFDKEQIGVKGDQKVRCCQIRLYSSNYMKYPIIRNGDQRWALEFLKNYQLPDADRFLILQGWALAIS